MLTWLRRDEALRGWLLWLFVGAALTSVMMGIVVMIAVRERTAIQPASVLISTWLGIAVYLAFGRLRTRCGPFHLALPLSARRVWLQHLVAVTVGGALVALAAAGVALLHVRVAGLLHARVVPGTAGLGPARMVAQALSGAVLAGVLLQLPKPGLARIPASRAYLAWVVAVLVAVPALIVALLPLGWGGAVVSLAVAAVTGGANLRRLPAGLSLLPLEAEAVSARGRAAPGESAGAVTAEEGGAPPRGVAARATWRGVSAGALEWMAYSFILLFAIIAGGGLSLLEEDMTILRYLYLPLTSYFLFSFMGPRLVRLHHLDPLPVPRRAMFATLVLPYLLVFCAGYGLGAALAGGAARRDERVAYREIGGAWRLLVTPDAYRIAWDGQVREATSPWGESHRPATVISLWRGSRAVLYSPFSTPNGSSRDFVALQLSRAAEAVYGSTLPPREIAERLLVTRADGVVAGRGGDVLLRRAYPGLSPRPGGPMFPVLVTLVCLPWLLATALLLRCYRPGVPEWARQALVWSLAGLVVVVFFGMAAATLTGLVPWLLYRVLVELPLRALGGSPAATAACWAVALALILLAYRFAEGRFRRMEIPTKPTRYTLIELAREES